MTISSVFHKGMKLANRGLTSAFNRISGNTALAERGLVRPNGNTFANASGLVLSSLPPLMVAAILPPLVGLPLTLIFAAAATVGGMIIPERLEAKALIREANSRVMNVARMPKHAKP